MAPPTVVYSNGNQESERLMCLLDTLNDKYLRYDLGTHFTESQFRSEFGDTAEYPQVSIGYEHIGSLKDALHYFTEKGII